METRPATQKHSIYLNPPKPFKIDEDIIMALIGISIISGVAFIIINSLGAAGVLTSTPLAATNIALVGFNFAFVVLLTTINSKQEEKIKNIVCAILGFAGLIIINALALSGYGVVTKLGIINFSALVGGAFMYYNSYVALNGRPC